MSLSDLAVYGTRNWWSAAKGECHRVILPYVRTVENFQAELFDKFVKLAATYDTNPRTNRYTSGARLATRLGTAKALITENLIASQIDTVAANVADSDIRVRIQTTNADWKHQRNAKLQETYLEGLSKLYDVGTKCRIAFKSAALKGTGLLKVWIDQFDQINVRTVPIDNVVVDEVECRDGKPAQLHYRDFFDREDLQAQFPEFKEQIEKAQTAGNWKVWAGYRPMQSHQVIVIESWRLPIGPKGHAKYVPGRHTIIIDGCDLLDEPYDKPFFPFAKMVWNQPDWGFYGISLAERILPHQNLLNRRNFQINTSLDKKINPTTYVHQGDQKLMVQTVSQIGAIAAYKVAVPVTVDHQAVGKETYDSVVTIKASAAHETGVDQMMQSGGVPGGIESGVGVREVRSTRVQRFSIQEKTFERGWLDTLWLVLDCCKDLGGTKAPDIVRVNKYGSRRIKWSEVDMDDLKIEMAASSTLGNTPAGREQRLTELAQAGVITLDESRELMQHNDIDATISMYNSMIESIEDAIERIEDGETGIVPEPFDNLEMGCVMMQRRYLLIKPGAGRAGGAPEEVLEGLSDFASIAANILNPPPAPQPAGPGLPPPPGAMPPGMPPGTGGPMPMGPGGLMPPGAPPPGMLHSQAAAGASTFAPGTFAPSAAG